MYTDVSIDLETLGVQPGSVITQIGLCAFNRRPSSGGEHTKSSTLILVNPQDAIERGLTIDWSTVAWWLKQDEAPRLRMADQGNEAHTLSGALMNVRLWMQEHGDPKKLCVWGHGCGFDCTQLEIAYNKIKMPVPWDFRNVRDLRTLIDLIPATRVERPLPTEAHNAMSDATAQAEWIQRLTYQIEKREVGRAIVEQPQGGYDGGEIHQH